MPEITPSAPATPGLDEFLAQAKPLNPQYSDADITAQYHQLYPAAAAAPPTTGPPPDKQGWLSEAATLNPAYTPEEIAEQYDTLYPRGNPVPPSTQGDTARGFTESFKQLPQLLSGVEAGVGAVGEKLFGAGGLSTQLKNYGIKGYQEMSAELAKDSKLTDSWNYSYDQALNHGNPGALVDWLQHGFGYVAGQTAQMVATGGIGSLAGKLVLKGATEKIVSGLVAKEAAALAGAEEVTAAITTQAVKNVAGKMGQNIALGATATGMEGGEIFGDLTAKAQEEGRDLTGAELLKASVMTGMAGVLEFAGDKLALHALFGKLPLGKSVDAATGLGGRLARGTVAGAGVGAAEGATEYGQTILEEWGKGTAPIGTVTSEMHAGAVDSAALGALGGTGVGGTGGLLTAPTPATPPLTPEEKNDPIAQAALVVQAKTVDEGIAIAQTITDGPVDLAAPGGAIVAAKFDNVIPPAITDGPVDVAAPGDAIVAAKLDNVIPPAITTPEGVARDEDQKLVEKIFDGLHYDDGRPLLTRDANGSAIYNKSPLRVLATTELPATADQAGGGISQENVAPLQAFLSLFGKRLVVVESNPNGGFDGLIHRGVDDTMVVVTQKTHSADVAKVMIHELFHHFEESPLYRAFRDTVWENRTWEGVAAAYARHTAARHTDSLQWEDNIKHEMASDLAGTEFLKPEVVAKIVARLNERLGLEGAKAEVVGFLDHVNAVIKQVKALFTSRAWTDKQGRLLNQQVTHLEQIHDTMAAAAADALYDVHVGTLREKAQKGKLALSSNKEARTVVHPLVAGAFTTMAEAHRGLPTLSTRRVQSANVGGVLNPVVEGASSLLRRMTDSSSRGSANQPAMKESVNRLLASLTHAYGFEKEAEQNLRNTAKGTGVTYAAVRDRVDAALKDYHAAHNELPVYNRAQWLAREVALAVGKKDIPTAIAHLKDLKEIVESPTYTEHAFEHTMTPEGPSSYLHPTRVSTDEVPSGPDRAQHYTLLESIPGHKEGETITRAQLKALRRRPHLTDVGSRMSTGLHPDVNVETRTTLSTTVPSAKDGLNNALTQVWHISGEHIKQSLTHLKSISTALRRYPGMSGKGTQLEVLAEFHTVVTSNVLWIYDLVPEHIRRRAAMWYTGANRIASEWATEDGYTLNQHAAVMAVNSPETDWYQNMSRADRIRQIVKNYGQFAFSQEMLGWVEAYAEDARSDDNIEARGRFLDRAKTLLGKKLDDLTGMDAAYFIRFFDETYHSKQYRVVTPEGGFNDYVRKLPRAGKAGLDGEMLGAPANMAWKSFNHIAKSVSILRDGSNENIHIQLGKKHKVRSFYNNILDPKSTEGHVTIDTHATGAGIFSVVAASDREPAHTFGKGGSNAATGASGSYGLLADAYRDAGKQRGVLPSSMQSVTWEAIRSIFPDTMKKKLRPLVKQIWRDVRKGDLTIEQGRDKIYALAGGIKEFNWEHGGLGLSPAQGGKSFDEGMKSDVDPIATGTRRLPGRRGVSGGERLLLSASGPYQDAGQVGTTLVGLPSPVAVDGEDVEFFGFKRAQDAARDYMTSAGLTYTPETVYHKLDKDLSTRIANAYEAMKDEPNDPEVKAAYAAMAKETTAQYRAILKTGLVVEFFPNNEDTYGNPRNAILDVVENNHFYVFSTKAGFGSNATFDSSKNPNLAETEFTVGGETMLVNDLFRVVHDYFGHVKEGNGFRGEGEDNAWYSHQAMYSPLARRAMTTETRGQNSWVNYGPHGEFNRKASPKDTIYADQKTGLLPDWAVKRVPKEGTVGPRFSQSAHDAYAKWLTQASLKMDQEAAGQDVLDTLSEHGITSTRVVDEFWRSTYQQLPKNVQERFQRYIKNVTGLGVGDVMSIARDGTESRARTWQDLYPASEPAADVEDLEGIERGLIALMAVGNARHSNTVSSNAPKALSYEGGPKFSVAQTKTPEFKAWFRKSKVVENGQPLVMYRGQPSNIEDPFLRGRYFTRDPAYASSYAEASDDTIGGSVSAVYIRAENPYIATDDDEVTDWNFDTAALRRQGYDAIATTDFDVLVPLQSDEQIKSAIGNSGDFGSTGHAMFSASKPPFGIPIDELPDGAKAPKVDWNKAQANKEITADPQSWTGTGWGKGIPVVYQAYVKDTPEDMPRARTEIGYYNWKQFKKTGVYPPVVIVIGADGIKRMLVDGNHRVTYWRSKKFDHFPAWIVDFRKHVDVKARMSAAPTFYSQVERVLEQKMPNKALSAQITGILSPANGVKPDEVKWLGMDDFLKTQSTFTKAEVLAFVKANNVQLEETMRGEKKKTEWIVYNDGHKYFDSREKAEAYAKESNVEVGEYTVFPAQAGLDRSNTKYARYQTPGGEAYRELLLTLPVKQRIPDAFEKLAQERYGKSFDYLSEAQQLDIEGQVGVDEFTATREASFQSTHFDEPNILVHIRFNDRIVDGKKVLFLEEVQSDWGQALRKSSALRKVSKPQSVGELAKNVFGSILSSTMPLTTMDGGVLSMLQHDQVRRAIIARLPVDVVDMLSAQNAPAEKLFGNADMMLSRLSADQLRTMANGLLSATRSVGAGLRATLLALQSRGVDEELLPALQASGLTAREVVGVLAPESLYHVGLSGRPGEANTANAGARVDFLETPIAATERAELGGRSAGANLEEPTARLTDVLDWHNKIISQAGTSEPVHYRVGPDVPDMPLEKTWHELALKRTLRYAAEHGYDTLAWTTGEMQTDRYDLRQQVDRIDYFKREDGLYDIEVRRADDDGLEGMQPLGPPVSENKLAETVGKDLAEKMVKGEGAVVSHGYKRFTGLDLKVGGEGMEGFYDLILPAFMNKYLKKWGTTVSPMQISTGVEGYESDPALGGTATVHAVTLTDEMRRSVVQEGQPRFSSRNPISPFPMSEPGFIDKWVRMLQDKDIDIKRVVEDLQAAGRVVADDINPIYAGEMYQKREQQLAVDFTNDELAPLVSRVAAAGFTLEQFDKFLHARHVIVDKVNSVLAAMNPNDPNNTALSGMTDTAATLIYKGPRHAELEALANEVDQMVAVSRTLLVEYGLEKEQTVAQWRKTFKAYVPLRREGFDDVNAYPTGTGKSVLGSTIKTRGGSTLAVESILANIAQARDQIISRGEKQRPVIAFAAMLIQNPNEAIGVIDKHVQITVPDPVTGLPVTVADNKSNVHPQMVRRYDPVSKTMQMYPDPSYKGDPNVVNFRIKGEDYSIVFNEHVERSMEIAKAFKNMGTDPVSGIMAAIAPYTRYLAAINTQYNPIFGVVNFVRDAQFAMLTLASTPLHGKQLEVLNNARKALGAIYADARAIRTGVQKTSLMGSLWQRFEHAGGPTGYRDIFLNTEERIDEIKRLMDPSAWTGIRSPRQLGARLEETPMFKLLSDYNLAMENSIRLGVFKAGIDAGLSDIAAASLAKNITVNFNKKGQLGSQAGSIYAFFNANVQGTARIAEVLFDRTKDGFTVSSLGKKVITGGLLVGVLQSFLLAMGGFDDDDPPEFVKQKNLIIPMPGTDKGYVMIPMPLGFNLLPTVGRLAAESVANYAMGRPINGFRKVSELLGATFSALSPVGGGGPVQTILPTVADPLAALYENRDFTGRKIYVEDRSSLDPTPGHARARDSSTVWAKLLAKSMNWVTGGSDFTPGQLSPTPDAIDYLIGQATGGIGREVSKTAQVIQKLAGGEDVPVYKLPLGGRFAGSASGEPAIRNRFYDNVTRANIAWNEVEGRAKSHQEFSGYLLGNPAARFAKEGTKIMSTLSDIKKNTERMRERGDSAEAIKLMHDRGVTLMQRYNDLLAKAEGQ